MLRGVFARMCFQFSSTLIISMYGVYAPIPRCIASTPSKHHTGITSGDNITKRIEDNVDIVHYDWVAVFRKKLEYVYEKI